MAVKSTSHIAVKLARMQLPFPGSPIPPSRTQAEASWNLPLPRRMEFSHAPWEAACVPLEHHPTHAVCTTGGTLEASYQLYHRDLYYYKSQPHCPRP